MLKITGEQGFQMTFSNNWTVSVQFGIGMGCNHYDRNDYDAPKQDDSWQCENAEIAAWHGEAGQSSDKWYQFGEGSAVKGWCSPDEIVHFMNIIRQLPDRPRDEIIFMHIAEYANE
jgi:hypothetical protein